MVDPEVGYVDAGAIEASDVVASVSEIVAGRVAVWSVV